MILEYFRRFFYFFEEYKRAFAKYAILSLIAAFLELFGVALTYPFVIKLLAESDKDNTHISIIIFGIIIVLMFLFKNIFMIFYVYIQTKFSVKFESFILKKVMNFFLSYDYSETSKISLAEKGKVTGLLIPNISNNFIIRLLNLNINILIFIMISLCIAIKFPLATAISIMCACLLIFIQNKIYKPKIDKISKRISETTLIHNQAATEMNLNVKSIKISGNEKYFFTKYYDSLIKNYNEILKLKFLVAVPPYIIEPLAIFALFILLAIISYQNYASPDKLVASFALVTTAIFRITPAISRIQVNFNGINSALPLVKEFIDFYEKYDIKNLDEIKEREFHEFKNTLELRNVFFEYEPGNPILQDINLKINKGDFIGFAGLSGVGKTTLADIIAGIFKPKSGEILVDDEKRDKYLKIGYIPQEMCLSGGNIRENVAFGNSDIDDERVIDSLKKAQLYNFIKEHFKNGIYANPFTDSSGFSLGQKQRLAIARALYSNPDILILDEATSSLDLKTEDEICKVLQDLKGQKTIIVIAHRLSTIKAADRIIFMENGKISEEGSFEELSEKSEHFRELVKLSQK